jgi:hypothetical protein
MYVILYGYSVTKTMYCIKQLSPPVYTLFAPTFPTIKEFNINKKSVRFSNDNEVYIISPRPQKMLR